MEIIASAPPRSSSPPSHFNHSGVNVRGKNVRVHHNFIHDVHAYPVVVGHKAELPMLIEANLIHCAWHAIAGSGDPGTGYEARYNRIVAQTPPASWWMPAPGHAFDMHARADRSPLYEKIVELVLDRC